MSLVKDEYSNYGYGRYVIYIDETEINDDNICKIVKETFIKHKANSQAQSRLFDYEKGKQPILDRKKDIRPEINHKLVDNEASKIVDFKLGYEFGNPINLVQRAKVEPCKDGKDDKLTDDDIKIALLNEMFVEENKESKDNKCARDFLISGIGYKMALPKKDVNGVAVFDYVIPNPLTTYIVRFNDVFRRKALGVTYSVTDNGKKVRLGAYTDDVYYYFDGTFDEFVFKEINGITKIPIVEYIYNHDRMGCFEKVIPLIDYKNIVNSDRLNDITQHVQSLLWMNDCELEETDRKKVSSGGMVVTRTTPEGKTPNIEYLSQVLNQSEIQTFADYLKDQINEQSGIPTKGDTGGGSTGSAMSLSNGWATAEQLAKITEAIYKQSELEFLDLVLTIIKNSNDVKNKDIKKLELSDIGIKFARNKTYDLGTKVNALATLLNSGVDGLRAFEVIDLFPDTQQAYLDSRENIDKKQRYNQEEKDVDLDNKKLNGEFDTDKRIMNDSSDNYVQSPIAKL